MDDDSGFADIMASVCINMATDETAKPVERRASPPRRPSYWQLVIDREERRFIAEWSVDGQTKH